MERTQEEYDEISNKVGALMLDEPEIQKTFKTQIVKVCINSQRNRDDIVRALGSEGHKVWVEHKSRRGSKIRDKYWVCFEIEANENG